MRACETGLSTLASLVSTAAAGAGVEGIQGWQGGRLGIASSQLTPSTAPSAKGGRGDGSIKIFCEMKASCYMHVTELATPEILEEACMAAASHCMARTHWLGEPEQGPGRASEERGVSAQSQAMRERACQAKLFERRLLDAGPLGAVFLKSLAAARRHQGKMATMAGLWGAALEQAVQSGLIPNPVKDHGDLVPRFDVALSGRHGWRLMLTGIHRDQGPAHPGKPYLGRRQAGNRIQGPRSEGVDLGGIDDAEELLWQAFSASAIRSMEGHWTPEQVQGCRPQAEALLISNAAPESKPRGAPSL